MAENLSSLLLGYCANTDATYFVGQAKETKAKMKNLLLSILAVCSFMAGGAAAQERPLPEEILALGAVCSTGGSVQFRGQIEGGVNRLLGKVIEGTGELNLSRNEADFLSSFDDEVLRKEARQIFNECVSNALRIAYNFREGDIQLSSGQSGSRILIPDPLTVVTSGSTFSMRNQESVIVQDESIIAIERTRFDGAIPVLALSKNGSVRKSQPSIGESSGIPNSSCVVTFYSRREIADKEYAYSFRLSC